MNKVNLQLNIIPPVDNLSSIRNYFPEYSGKIMSTIREIKVNKIPNGYSIIYNSEDITNMDMDILSNNIIKLFMKNVPNTIINISIFNYYEIDNEDEEYDYIEMNLVNALLSLENKFMHLPENGSIPFTYTRSKSMDYLATTITENYNDVFNNDEDEDDYYPNTPNMNNYFESFGLDDHYNDSDGDEDDDDDIISLLNPNGNKKHKKKNIQSSKIFYEAKNAKRAYNRHGVIICTSKKSKERDEKILKEFLKEFFPGDAEWKKNFRKDVLKRWMKMYCISKGNLKDLEKANRKAKNFKRNNNKNEKTLDFTKRLFNVPIDKWNDPSR